jgi:hypothetical protein
LSRIAQALAAFEVGDRAALALRIIALCAACGLLGACASGGFSMAKAEVDPSILTGNVDGSKPATAGYEQISDVATIRNAVSAADIEGLKGAALPWANAETGARGTISAMSETTTAGVPCRNFTTTRENFDGISLYTGEVCRVGPGAWRMEKFAAQ